MSAEQVIDLVGDENDDVIVIDDSPKTSISEDSPMLDADRSEELESKPFDDQDPIPVDMDMEDDVIPISNQTYADFVYNVQTSSVSCTNTRHEECLRNMPYVYHFPNTNTLYLSEQPPVFWRNLEYFRSPSSPDQPAFTKHSLPPYPESKCK